MSNARNDAAKPADEGVTDQRGRIVPFWLVGDESRSMAGKPIRAINEQLTPLHAAITSEPVLSDRVRFGIIAFAQEAEEILPLSDLWEVTTMPMFDARGGTNYRAAFHLLHDRIDAGVTDLAAQGYQVLRPMVLFFSDGRPNAISWEKAHRALLAPDFVGRPNIITFGFGRAKPDVLRRIATIAHFQADRGVTPADAIREFAQAITRSVVQSARAVSTGAAVLPPPAVPVGFTAMAPITLDAVA